MDHFCNSHGDVALGARNRRDLKRLHPYSACYRNRGCTTSYYSRASIGLEKIQSQIEHPLLTFESTKWILKPPKSDATNGLIQTRWEMSTTIANSVFT